MAVGDYKKYLAENVVSEQRAVTYRSLGRALRVHSTLAKQYVFPRQLNSATWIKVNRKYRMLYDFHRNENAKRPSSINATYVVTGIPKPAEPATNGAANGSGDNDDSITPSGPYISSSMPNQEDSDNQIPVSTVLLAREEDLEGKLLREDLNVLTDANREMLVNHSQEDPLEYGKQWGMIQNTTVKRRTGARPPPPPVAPSTVPAKRPAQPEPVKSHPVKSEPTKEEHAEPPKPVQRQNSSSSAKSTEKAAPAKKDKGNLFSSFAKAKPKPKKEESSASVPSAAESAEPSGAEDVVLYDASEDEQEELFPESKKESQGESRESRKEREERLRKMMEDDDEDDEMADAAEPPAEPEIIDKPPPKQEELKVEATVKGGRRRGRRQVMKKAVKKDSEGYLVTVEEPSWESFSEDEPAPPPPKKKPAVSAPKGKAGAKAGQGNIMSFFGKK
ncbi:DNA polymerase subunit Cdc27 [Aspergillus unguis]